MWQIIIDCLSLLHEPTIFFSTIHNQPHRIVVENDIVIELQQSLPSPTWYTRSICLLIK